MRDALADLDCDLDDDGDIGNDEALFCIEMGNSDGDGSGWTNIDEIGRSTQPGWTNGPDNALFSNAGTTTGVLAPDGIGTIDPDGTEPPPPVLPPPPGEIADIPPGQIRRGTIVVKPGQSIQRAIDIARHGTRIYVLAGTYREFSDPTSGLVIKKSGIRLIGQKARNKRVVLDNGTNPLPSHPFAPFAADLILLTLGDWGNCFAGNVPETLTSVSFLGFLPPCP